MGAYKILDGAMGSELIKRGLSLPNHIWAADANIHHPKLVQKIHRQYVDAGADYIITNTFRTTPRAYQKTELNRNKACQLAEKSLIQAVEHAKNAADPSAKIIGSIAPLEDCYRPDLFPGKSYAKEEFSQISNWLYDADIDIFLIETMNNIDEAISCLDSVKKYNIPTWISFVLLDDKHILSGESLGNVIKILEPYNIDCFLINCNPLDKTKEALRSISKKWKGRWGIYPNLGIGDPSTDGRIKDISTDKEFIDLIVTAILLGVNVMGGCCGATPKHIKLINEYLRDKDKN